jgi:hypothetical protein
MRLVNHRGECWPPLQPLGELGNQLDQALASQPLAEVEQQLVHLEQSVSTPTEQASLLAAKFAVQQRLASNLEQAELLAIQASTALRVQGLLREASFLDVERATLLSTNKQRLPEALQLALSLPVSVDDLSLSAAVLRARGAVHRARADLRASLLSLEQSRVYAERCGNARESLRTCNTLGTSYVVLGVAELAREALEHAREIAEVQGHRISAAIASGQLAVLAVDLHQPELAIRHLETQRLICEQMADHHGLARALSLLVEAYGLRLCPESMQNAAALSRDLYTRVPTRWTRLQAIMATLYEAESAWLNNDHVQAKILMDSCQEELSSPEPGMRLIQARASWLNLLAWQHDPQGPLCAVIERCFEGLRRSPRPTWVERLLDHATHVAQAHQQTDLAFQLGLRSCLLKEARSFAVSGGLAHLRDVEPELAVTRAMARGRDLMLRVQLALAPLDQINATLFHLELNQGSPDLQDEVIQQLNTGGDASTEHHDVYLFPHGPWRLLVVVPDPTKAELCATQIATLSGIAAYHQTSERIRIRFHASTEPFVERSTDA